MKFFRRDFIKNSLFATLGALTIGRITMEVFKKNKVNKKKLIISYSVNEKHWVGNGFYVHGLLRPTEDLNKYISPFILMDYASPLKFSSSEKRRGVGEHPHRGFETVTFAYSGEVEHRDSSGGGGIIKPGDVQWMTAGSGVVHEEFHSDEYTKKGGIFEMVQLWVNLPKKDKMTKPKYQGIKNESIPRLNLGKQTELRVIAGEYEGVRGPASTFSSINMYDLNSREEQSVSLNFNEGTNTIVLIMSGELELEGKSYKEQNVLIFDQAGEELVFKASKNFKGLILNGEPIQEPIVTHGPFVMNTRQEIIEAIEDYQSGKMGRLN